jgi:glycosyltransferase involved in cell wall biosynthesis
MPNSPDLSVVIPVFDAAETIGALIETLVGLEGVGVEVIAVDDASSDGSPAILERLAREHPAVTARFNGVNRGAGLARNTGFELASGRYTLFFDADDVLHPDALRTTIRELDRVGADVALTPYRYRRSTTQDYEAMNGFDQEIWAEYAPVGLERQVFLRETPRLLAFSAYPWNKVLRTDRYRDVGLRFGSTPVHNDVLGHWYALMYARSILLVDAEICTHIVEASGPNLTNQHSRVRLSLINALNETYDLLESDESLRRRYAHQYWGFATRTAGWALARIDPLLQDEFKARLEVHVRRMRVSDYARMRAGRSGAIADSVLRTIMR